MTTQLETYQNQVAELYLVFFGRAPDAEGMSHWIDALSNGATIHDLAVGFSKSDEYQSHYGDLSASEAIRRFYQNALDREADRLGLDYWLDKIDQGHTFYEVAVGKIEAAFNGGDNVDTDDTAIVRNKVEVSKYVSLTLASNDQQLVDGALDGVTDDPISVTLVNEALSKLNTSGSREINGSPFPDTLIGGNGDDTIIGQAGPDVLVGKGGRDTFKFRHDDGGNTLETADVIYDFGLHDTLIAELSIYGRIDTNDFLTSQDIVVSDSGTFISSYEGFASLADERIQYYAMNGKEGAFPYIYVVTDVGGSGDAWVVLNREDYTSFDDNDSLIILKDFGSDFDPQLMNFEPSYGSFDW